MKNKWEESLAALSVGQQFAYKVKDDARKDKIRRFSFQLKYLAARHILGVNMALIRNVDEPLQPLL